MRYVSIPKTELKVSGFCLGSAEFGSTFDREVSFDTLDRFVASGGNFVDTAILYADWIPNIERSASEKTIGRWLKSRNAYDKIIVATKGGAPHPETRIPTLSKEELEPQIEASRKNLGIDTIELYYLHRDDPNRTVEEIMDVLFEVREKGKIKHIACSNWTAARIRQANEYAKKCKKAGFVAVSNRWSLAMPIPGASKDKTLVDMNDELYQLHTECDIAAIPFSSTAQAYLSRVANGEDPNHVIYGSAENKIKAERAKQLALEKKVTVAQLALSYFYSHPFTAVPITAFRTPEQMQEAVAATEIILSDEEFSFLTGK